MRKYIFIFLVSLLILAVNCKDILVYYPIPLKSTAPEFYIQTAGGSYNLTIPLDLAIYFKDLEKKLIEDYGVSFDEVDRVIVEGASFTILQTDADVTITGSVNIGYGTDSQQFMTLDNVSLNDILNTPQMDALTPEGVSLLNQAMEDYLTMGGQSTLISLNTNGTITSGTSGNAIFIMLLEFTITTVIKKRQEVFDPLG